MKETQSLYQLLTNLLAKVLQDVFAAASNMQGTIIAAAAFGGFCLFLYRVISYYKSFNHDLLSKEHALAFALIIISIFALPIFGVIFVGIYGITNHIAAWQIGLTTPMLIESAYLTYGQKASSSEYLNKFMPEQADA